MKIVSVIVPCHNAAKWLPQCFLSLVQQSIGMDALELIFVDDASDDAGETWALLEEFERAYPESIMIIHLEDNLRQGGARNVALGYATGEYLAFVDADDFVEGDFFEKVYRRAIERDADIVQFDYVYYTERLGKVASVLGDPLTDRYMNPIERGFAERFLRVEKMISNNAMAEMMYWAGRESYAECLLGAAGVVYWSLRKQQVVIKTIDENSRWMSRFVHLAMRQDENGEIVWKTWISRADGEQLKTLFERKENRHLIGAELLLRNNVEYEESKQRQDIYEMLKVCIEKGGGCHR